MDSLYAWVAILIILLVGFFAMKVTAKKLGKMESERNQARVNREKQRRKAELASIAPVDDDEFFDKLSK